MIMLIVGDSVTCVSTINRCYTHSLFILKYSTIMDKISHSLNREIKVKHLLKRFICGNLEKVIVLLISYFLFNENAPLPPPTLQDGQASPTPKKVKKSDGILVCANHSMYCSHFMQSQNE